MSKFHVTKVQLFFEYKLISQKKTIIIVRIYKKNNKNPFLLFMSFTHSFSICLSEIPSKLALSDRHIENSLTA